MSLQTTWPTPRPRCPPSLHHPSCPLEPPALTCTRYPAPGVLPFPRRGDKKRHRDHGAALFNTTACTKPAPTRCPRLGLCCWHRSATSPLAPVHPSAHILGAPATASPRACTAIPALAGNSSTLRAHSDNSNTTALCVPPRCGTAPARPACPSGLSDTRTANAGTCVPQSGPLSPSKPSCRDPLGSHTDLVAACCWPPAAAGSRVSRHEADTV